jgi:hypothetical protein
MTFINEVAKNETDCRIKFRRVSDDSIYCVLAPLTFKRLQKANELDAFLKKERDSGIVIRPINK